MSIERLVKSINALTDIKIALVKTDMEAEIEHLKHSLDFHHHETRPLMWVCKVCKDECTYDSGISNNRPFGCAGKEKIKGSKWIRKYDMVDMEKKWSENE